MISIIVRGGQIKPISDVSRIYIPNATGPTIAVPVEKYMFWHSNDLFSVRVALMPGEPMPPVVDLLPYAQPVDDPSTTMVYGSRLRALVAESASAGLIPPRDTWDLAFPDEAWPGDTVL